MLWQDAVMTTVGVAFTIALLPAIWASNKPPRFTCLLTAVGLSIFVLTTWTLGLYFTSINNALTASLWWVLFWQARHERPLQPTREHEPPRIIDVPDMDARGHQDASFDGLPCVRYKYRRK